MKFNKVAILTSRSSWFVPHAKKLVGLLKGRGLDANLFSEHEKVGKEYQVVFVLSYFRLIPERFLKGHSHNLVVHESALPKGRGWSPLFWQILEGKNKIPVVLFEMTDKMDEGNIYIKDFIHFKGHELHEELREAQAAKTIEMCLRFLDECETLKPVKQKAKATFYNKRTPENSELDINRSIREQFNLIRTVNNAKFPAFFRHKGYKYVIKISKARRVSNREVQTPR